MCRLFIIRCTRALTGYEEKLHLVEKFLSAKRKVARIHRLAESFKTSRDDALIDEIGQISNQLSEEL